MKLQGPEGTVTATLMNTAHRSRRFPRLSEQKCLSLCTGHQLPVIVPPGEW